MMNITTIMPSSVVLEPMLRQWLLEDIGRGDRTTQGLGLHSDSLGKAEWIIKEAGVVAGVAIAARVFQLLDHKVTFLPTVTEGTWCEVGEKIASIEGS